MLFRSRNSVSPLPRVEELFEARKPKGLAIITEIAGVANLNDTKKKREIIVTNQQTGETKTYLIPYGSRIKVQDGAVLEAGDELTEGSVNPHDLLKIKGLRAAQDYMLQEVQRVYRLQVVPEIPIHRIVLLSSKRFATVGIFISYIRSVCTYID